MRITGASLYSAFDTGDTRPIVDFLLWLVSSHKTDGTLTILDAGCGPGRMLKEFSLLGWNTVGLEPNPEFYAQADELARSLPKTSVIQGGLNDLEAENRFDLIGGINASFSYLLTPAQRADALSRMYKALRPGGCLFIDMANFPFVLRNYRAPKNSEATLNGITIHKAIEHQLDWHHDTLTHTDTFTFHDPERGDQKVTQIHKFGIFGFAEIEYFLKIVGFTEIRTYNSYAARQSETINGARLMVSAQKGAK